MKLERATIELGVARRSESRREEWDEHVALAGLLAELLDPACVFWTSLENKPMSALSGIFQKRRGVKGGLPDVVVLFRDAAGMLWVVFVELKSKRGAVSAVQKERRLELLRIGAQWWLARSARAALVALHRSGVPFRSKWRPPTRLEPWEGPFSDPAPVGGLPQHPQVARERQQAKARYRARLRARKAELAAAEAAERAAEMRHAG